MARCVTPVAQPDHQNGTGVRERFAFFARGGSIYGKQVIRPVRCPAPQEFHASNHVA